MRAPIVGSDVWLVALQLSTFAVISLDGTAVDSLTLDELGLAPRLCAIWARILYV